MLTIPFRDHGRVYCCNVALCQTQLALNRVDMAHNIQKKGELYETSAFKTPHFFSISKETVSDNRVTKTHTLSSLLNRRYSILSCWVETAGDVQ
jgi:hypothetical protein